VALEIRPHLPEETDAFYRVPAIVFGHYTGQPFAGPRIMLPEWTLCAFEDGELATAYGAFPLTQLINGVPVAAAGVSFVGTLPQFRRRGHLRKIHETDFRRRFEERREPLAILTASIAGIYQRYGYAVVTTSARYSIDPRWIKLAPSLPAAPGAFREGTKEELPLLQRIYDEFTGQRNGFLQRLDVVWEMQTLGINAMFDPVPLGPSVISIYEEAGEAKGYVAWAPKWLPSFTLDNAGPGQRIVVRDFAWNTPGAYRAMWDMFSTFDLAARVHFEHAPTDDPAFHVMLDPRELNTTHRDVIMARILDVERLLPMRPYAAAGRMVFDLRDEFCPWNAGRWSLETGEGGSRVSRTTETAQLALDVSALAQLLYGQVSPANAVRYGRAEASPDAPLERWDDMFRTKFAPFCPNLF
jgi:predicted acetyltransferase